MADRMADVFPLPSFVHVGPVHTAISIGGSSKSSCAAAHAKVELRREFEREMMRLGDRKAGRGGISFKFGWVKREREFAGQCQGSGRVSRRSL